MIIHTHSHAHTLRAILSFTFIVLSISLQSQLRNQTHVAAKTSWSPTTGWIPAKFELKAKTNGWSILDEAFRNDLTLNRYHCDSNEYYAYSKSLPPVMLSDLRIPPNTRMLFYGHSYLEQVMDYILIANEDILIKDGPFGGFEGDVIDTYKADHLPGYFVEWNFTVNSSIVDIQNYLPMQDPENVTKLAEFLQESYFDIAFFMNPHPRCMFVDQSSDDPWCQCTSKCRNIPEAFQINHNDNLREMCHMACDEEFEGDTRGVRSDVKPLWDIIHNALKGKVHEVEAWSKEGRTWFHADSHQIIPTYPILNGHWCNVMDECASKQEVVGHQCQPGHLAFVAQSVMAKTMLRMKA